MRPILKGEICDVEVVWEEMYSRTRPFAEGAAVNAISGVDIALWDVVGRPLGKPVHKLLGGAFRERLTPYATGFYRREDEDPIEAGVEEACQRVSEDFGALKLKVGFGVEEDVRSPRRGTRPWSLHVWGTGVGLAASPRFVATLPPNPLSLNPEEPMLEYDRSPHPFREDPIYGTTSMRDGEVTVPAGPGIGVEVDHGVLELYGRRHRQTPPGMGRPKTVEWG